MEAHEKWLDILLIPNASPGETSWMSGKTLMKTRFSSLRAAKSKQLGLDLHLREIA
jgi:hypothetical protein